MNNRLVSPLDEWQCTDAVLGSAQASKAARNVRVGGGTWMDAFQRVLKQPALWATLSAIALNFLNQNISPTVTSFSQKWTPNAFRSMWSLVSWQPSIDLSL